LNNTKLFNYFVLVINTTHNIQIVKKPEYITWNYISKVIYASHAQNRANGLDIRNAHLTGDDLQESLGDDGECFVALNDKDEVVGTCSVAFHQLNRWYAKGRYAYLTLDAVLPLYTGCHIYSKLSHVRQNFIEDNVCDGMYINIAEGNYLRRKIAQKEGFKQIELRRTLYNAHYYLVYIKWFNKKHHPFFINIAFLYSSIKLKILLFFKDHVLWIKHRRLS